MKLNFALLGLSGMLAFSACKKDGCTDPAATNYNADAKTDDGSCIIPYTYNVPSTYAFVDANGNSTVSYNGQAQRLEMLSEMTTYMKTANTSGTSLSANQLKDMFANNGITWTDADNLGMTGSSKQLKNKAAGGDVTIIALFESYMDSIASVSASLAPGSQGVPGVVTSTSNPSKKYLQSSTGHEYTQLIEKGLMGAVFYYQIVQHYLSPAVMNVDNASAVDAGAGKYYTEMEHHWDEAYGYFTTAVDYPATGSDRFWGKYANSREVLMNSATKIAEAFRKGRAAIANNDIPTRDAQIAIIKTEMELMIAGTAIHYLNSAKDNIADDALRNHALSEAVAFLSDLAYGSNPAISYVQINAIIATIGSDFYAVSAADLTSARDELSNIMGLNSIKEVL